MKRKEIAELINSVLKEEYLENEEAQIKYVKNFVEGKCKNYNERLDKIANGLFSSNSIQYHNKLTLRTNITLNIVRFSFEEADEIIKNLLSAMETVTTKEEGVSELMKKIVAENHLVFIEGVLKRLIEDTEEKLDKWRSCQKLIGLYAEESLYMKEDREKVKETSVFIREIDN